MSPVTLRRARAREPAWCRWRRRGRGRRGWIVPVLSLLAIPPLVIVVPFLVGFMLAWAAIRQSPSYASIRDNLWFGLVVRGLWLCVAILGLESLVSDASSILE